MKKIISKITILTISGLLLVSCGGGGGGGGGNTAKSISDVAKTTPIEGSVIQYVRAKDIANIGINSAANGDITFENILNLQGTSSFTLKATDNIGLLSGNITSNQFATAREYQKALPNNETLGAAIITISKTSPREHLTAGVWIEDYSENSTIGDLGIFVDGGTKFNTNNMTALTGTKEYRGFAFGYYRDIRYDDFDEGDGDIPDGWYDRNASIRVDFGTINEIGTITLNIQIRNLNITYISDAGVRTDINPNIDSTLKAKIGNEEGGFTTGNTIATDDFSGPGRYSGKWGSQFYYTEATGGKPKYIAGTLGGTGTNAASNYGTFIGAFFAE